MSSDTFHIRIKAIEGNTVDLLCVTSTAGGYNDFAVTRSFALMALEDLLPYRGQTPLQIKMRELGGETPPVWEQSFHRAHVATFIASTELLERIGIIDDDDEAEWRLGRFDELNADPDAQYPLHRFVLRVTLTDPKWLEGITVGASGGTTAFDAWWDDPTRPTNAQINAVTAKASRWQPPGKKKAARKKTAKKAPAKKTAKKAPAKKTPAKKAAKKAPAKKAPAKKTAKKAPAKKTAKKAAAKKTAKKAPAKKTAKKASAKKAAKRTPAAPAA